MPLAAYDPSANGPSDAALMDRAQIDFTTGSSRNAQDYTDKLAFSNYGFGQPDTKRGGNSQAKLPMLQSSLGASGQYGSGAGNDAMKMAQTQHAAQNADITSQFHRTQDDLTRQQAYAAWGLVL